MVSYYITSFVLLFLVYDVVNGAENAQLKQYESCYSYAGGSVYPGSQHQGHQIHITQAVSEYQNLFIVLFKNLHDLNLNI